ncbi:MAG: hypothetical protein JWN44_3081 [Myxococcales bacterium]|nr:hypothetical protein [Myxococcales bacterium]
MRTTFLLSATLAAAVAGMMMAGCGNAVDMGPGGTMQSALQGHTWLSEGADVAPLLAGPPFNNVKITAAFNPDNSYDVVGTDKDNKVINYKGTYTTMESGVPGIVTIKLTQTLPTPTVADGMYQIDTSVTPPRLIYEVVQTQPTNGLQPPTADKGFGSTIYNGKPIATLIQKFSRQ